LRRAHNVRAFEGRTRTQIAGTWLLEVFALIALSPTETATFATMAGVLIIVCLLACYLPARRIVKIEPLEALREE